MTDVATPLTFERYTGDGKGMFMRWMRSSGFQRKHGYVRKTVPRLDNLCIASNETTNAITKERRVTNQATSTDGLCSSPDVPCHARTAPQASCVRMPTAEAWPAAIRLLSPQVLGFALRFSKALPSVDRLGSSARAAGFPCLLIPVHTTQPSEQPGKPALHSRIRRRRTLSIPGPCRDPILLLVRVRTRHRARPRNWRIPGPHTLRKTQLLAPSSDPSLQALFRPL